MLYENMLIDTPYKLTEVEDHVGKPGHLGQSQCTYCLSIRNGAWYSYDDIHVVRSWKVSSRYTPEKRGVDSGGWYSWRCPDHPLRGSSPNGHLAPDHLRPTYTQRCDARELGTRCEEVAEGNYDAEWLCERHARPIILRLRADELLNDEDEMDGPPISREEPEERKELQRPAEET